MSKLTWRFTLEPLIDGEPAKQKYGYVVDDPKDDLDREDLLMQAGNDFGGAMVDFKKHHPEFLRVGFN